MKCAEIKFIILEIDKYSRLFKEYHNILTELCDIYYIYIFNCMKNIILFYKRNYFLMGKRILINVHLLVKYYVLH